MKMIHELFGHEFFGDEINFTRSDTLALLQKIFQCELKISKPKNRSQSGYPEVSDLDGRNSTLVSPADFFGHEFRFDTQGALIPRSELETVLQGVQQDSSALSELARFNIKAKRYLVVDAANPTAGSLTLFVEKSRSAVESWIDGKCVLIEKAIAALPTKGTSATLLSAEAQFAQRIGLEKDNNSPLARITKKLYSVLLGKRANKQKAHTELKGLAAELLEHSFYALFFTEYVPDSEPENRRNAVFAPLITHSAEQRQQLRGVLRPDQIIEYFASSLLVVINGLNSSDQQDDVHYTAYRAALLGEAVTLIGKLAATELYSRLSVYLATEPDEVQY